MEQHRSVKPCRFSVAADPLWRGSLLPLGCAAAPERLNAISMGWAQDRVFLPPPPVGASLLAMKSPQSQSQTSPPHHQKSPLLQPPPTPHPQATHPCAFAYNYARIRPLVRLVPGLYCFPATAHQWSGLVARGCVSKMHELSSRQVPTMPLMVAVRRALRRAGNADLPGLLTCVQPPPFF